MADLKPELISVLRDIRDIKYPDIVDKHGEVVVNAGLTLGYKDLALTYKDEASASALSALNNKNSIDANLIISNANVVQTNADVITTTAKALIASQVLAMTATASTLVSGSLASVSYNSTTGIMSLGIPTGPKGDKGDAFVINALGTLVGRSAYNLQPINFTYYATDIGEIYFKLSATSGDWSIGSPFGKGDTGDTGNGIASITLTGSVANIDTYRILYTDATFFDFNVTNGSVASVAGRTGAITLTKTDVGLSNVDNTSDLNKPLSTTTVTKARLWQNQAVTITPPSNADYTLTADQKTYGRLKLVNGSWLSAHNIIVDNTERSFLVDNSAGTYTATVKTSAGTGIAVASGAKVWLLCDGTNVIESTSSSVQIASTAEAQAGTDNTKVITPLRLREGLNASGTAPIYACRAWVNFNGTGTVAIRASGNVSSITDNGVGDYTVNFITAMQDGNYSVSGIVGNGSGGTNTVYSVKTIDNSRATTSVPIVVSYVNPTNMNYLDCINVDIKITR